MKKLLLLSGCIFLFFTHSLLAQKGRTIETKNATSVTTFSKHDLDILPFEKGKWEFTITRQDIGYSHKDIKTNDVSQGSQSQFSLNLGTNYYVADHIGIGLELNAGFNAFKNNGNKQTSSNWMTYANFTYGTPINDQLGFYVRAGLGVGGNMNKYTPATGTSTSDHSNLYGYKFSAGFPIQLEHNGQAYFTPELHYRYLHDKFDGGTETDNRFGLGLCFDTYLFCREMECDHCLHYALSNHSYDQGRSYIGVTTRGMFNFGDNESKYINSTFNNKIHYSQIDLQANYMYYIVHDFALGVDIDFSNSVNKNDAVNFRQTMTGFEFKPMVELNIPSTNQGLNNLFIQGGYGFGFQNNEIKNGNSTITTKYNTTDFCVGLGYNFFFHKGLSFTPVFDYDIATSKAKDTGIKTKYTGPELGIGIRHFF